MKIREKSTQMTKNKKKKTDHHLKRPVRKSIWTNARQQEHE